MQIVLVNPEIPQNTGSIARTCAATGTPLHLVGRLGFDISEKAVRRAGLDYWPYVRVVHHSSWEAYQAAATPPRVWLLSTHGTKLYYEADFREGDALVFGSETKGLGAEFMSRFPSERILRIPITCEHVRSLNLSNAASIVLYEALRQVAVRSPRG